MSEGAVIDVSDFQRDVLDASRQKPVVVDFWAPWCGPCRQLSPILERIAAEADGKWTLAKVNTDDHPESARRYHVRGIPNVMLFVDGEVIDEFTGVLPERGVRQWLSGALGAPEENGSAGPAGRIDMAREALSAGKEQEAEQLLWQELDEGGNEVEARILLARLLVFRDPQRAQSLLTDTEFETTEHADLAESVQKVVTLLERCAEADELPSGTGREAYLAGLNALEEQSYSGAFRRFIEVIETDRGYDDDGARRACVALFALLGEEHPVVKEYRRPFTMSLY